MTAGIVHLRSTAPGPARRGLRADPLAATLLAAVAVGVVALWIALVATPARSGGPDAGRVAIVVDAGGRPDVALASAERARSRAAVAVRVPRTPFEAATDVRYFAAQRYGTVVAVGPVARGAARSVAGEFPRTRFVLRARLP